MDFSNDPQFVAAVAKEVGARLSNSVEFREKVAKLVAAEIGSDRGTTQSIVSKAASFAANQALMKFDSEIKAAVRREVAAIIAQRLGAKVAKLANQMAARIELADFEED